MRFRLWFEFKTENSDFSKSVIIRSAISFLNKAAVITKKLFGNKSKELARIMSIIGFLIPSNPFSSFEP
jgi:predicted metallopeptidase